MIAFRLIVLTLLMTIATGFPSSPSPPPQDLIDDLRRIATKIFSDRENLEKLTSQIQKISSAGPNLFNSVEVAPKSTHGSYQMAPESSQPGGNPLVVVQSRINAFFESMNQLFKNMRQVIERIPVPEDAELNPLKALQTLENQFQNMLSGLVVPDPATVIKPAIVNGTNVDKPQSNGTIV
ncbi:uncharacterized protein LOC107363655 [Tetranychus urticae]|nr:uncharacterized protein LOC107363655 [Tetranychus urticae]